MTTSAISSLSVVVCSNEAGGIIGLGVFGKGDVGMIGLAENGVLICEPVGMKS